MDPLRAPAAQSGLAPDFYPCHFSPLFFPGWRLRAQFWWRIGVILTSPTIFHSEWTVMSMYWCAKPRLVCASVVPLPFFFVCDFLAALFAAWWRATELDRCHFSSIIKLVIMLRQWRVNRGASWYIISSFRGRIVLYGCASWFLWYYIRCRVVCYFSVLATQLLKLLRFFLYWRLMS